MGHAPVVRDRNLSLEDDLAADRGKFAERCAEQACAVTPPAANQLEPAAPVYDGGDPVPIVFDLVKPAVAPRRLGRRRHDGETDAGR